MKHVAIVLDNAMVNQFVVGWMGLVSVLSPAADHTEFNPDEAFVRISHTFYRQGVFTGKELSCITGRYGLTYEMDGSIIFCWKEQLSHVYKLVPHIKDLHNFVWQKVADDQPRLQSTTAVQ